MISAGKCKGVNFGNKTEKRGLVRVEVQHTTTLTCGRNTKTHTHPHTHTNACIHTQCFTKAVAQPLIPDIIPDLLFCLYVTISVFLRNLKTHENINLQKDQKGQHELLIPHYHELVPKEAEKKVSIDYCVCVAAGPHCNCTVRTLVSISSLKDSFAALHHHDFRLLFLLFRVFLFLLTEIWKLPSEWEIILILCFQCTPIGGSST